MDDPSWRDPLIEHIRNRVMDVLDAFAENKDDSQLGGRSAAQSVTTEGSRQF